MAPYHHQFSYVAGLEYIYNVYTIYITDQKYIIVINSEWCQGSTLLSGHHHGEEETLVARPPGIFTFSSIVKKKTDQRPSCLIPVRRVPSKICCDKYVNIWMGIYITSFPGCFPNPSSSAPSSNVLSH